MTALTSGGIQAYVPAADIRVVLYTSLANPKSVIFKVLFFKLSSSMASFIRTENYREERSNQIGNQHFGILVRFEYYRRHTLRAPPFGYLD